MYPKLISIFLCLLMSQVAFANPHVKKRKFNLPFTITVKPGTFLPEQVAVGSSVHAIYQITNNNPITANNATIVSLPPYSTMEATGCGARRSFTLAPGQSCTLTINISAVGLTAGKIIESRTPPNVLMACWNDGVSCAGTNDLLHLVIPAPSIPYQTLMQDILINADLWGHTCHSFCKLWF